MAVIGDKSEFLAMVESKLYSAAKELVEEAREGLTEKFRIKVNSKGERTRKVICPRGMKSVDGHCVTMTGSEKMNHKRGSRKAAITKKSKSQTAANRKRRVAIRKRHSMGL